MKALKKFKKVFKKTHTAVLLALGVLGLSLIVNSLSNFLPRWISGVWQFIIGLGLVLLTGYGLAGKRKRR